MKLLQIRDEYSLVFRWKIRNETFACQLALAQLIVTAVSLAQHVYSFVHFNDIFMCSFNQTLSLTSGKGFSNFLSYDVIIFDFGLFHQLIQVQECIANYLDGGYMRCLWCTGQLLAIFTLLAIPFIRRPHPLALWPVLTMQNSYCFGLMILTIATADKLLVSLIQPQENAELTGLIFLFFLGTGTNYFLLYVLWHFYWHVEAEYRERMGGVVPSWL